MLRRFSFALAIVAFALAVPTGAVAKTAARGAVGAFELQGTNGYSILGIAAVQGEGKPGAVLLVVEKPGAQAIYQAEGEVTPEKVDVEFGALGLIDIESKPTGITETVHPICGKSMTVEGREWVGTMRFRGEEGFTAIEATRAPLLVKPIFDLVCPGWSSNTRFGKRYAGVSLEVRHHGGPFLNASENHPGGPVRYRAGIVGSEVGRSVTHRRSSRRRSRPVRRSQAARATPSCGRRAAR